MSNLHRVKRAPFKVAPTSIRGVLLLEPAMIMIYLYIILLLINNGIVSTTHQEWRNCCYASTLSCVKIVINHQKKNIRQNNPAISDFVTNNISTTFSGIASDIEKEQVDIQFGRWSSAGCTFETDYCDDLGGKAKIICEKDKLNACRVTISPPTDSDGKPTGPLAVFGRIALPLFQKIKAQRTTMIYNENYNVIYVCD